MKNRKVYSVVIIIMTIIAISESIFIISTNGNLRFSQKVTEETDQRDLSAAFDKALADGSIEVWFQPIADPVTGNTAGAEALSRWKDGDSYISPGVFVPVLEATGQVTALDRNVFEKTCELQKERLNAGEELFPIAVNLSVASAMEDGIVSEYAKVLESCGLPAGCVCIEVTETMESEAVFTADIVRAFQAAGFPVEIDDFGSGYAALAKLAVIPYDTLKIDKSLTDEIGTERGDLLVRTVIDMAKALGMNIIAEGVETGPQVDFLRTAGCVRIQGYYYSRALPKAEFLNYLK